MKQFTKIEKNNLLKLWNNSLKFFFFTKIMKQFTKIEKNNLLKLLFFY